MAGEGSRWPPCQVEKMWQAMYNGVILGRYAL